MPKTARPLRELDELAAEDRVSIDIHAEFALSDDVRLVVDGGTGHDDKSPCALGITVTGGGRGPALRQETLRRKTPSSALRALVKMFPDAAFPPASLQVRCSGSQQPAAALQKLFLAGLAEAFGRELPPVPVPTQKPDGADTTAWVETLKAGPAGVKKWNRLKAAERKAIDLGGLDLGGHDLTGAVLRGVGAKRASFVGATLVDAEMSDAVLDKADFSNADLQGANLKGVRAPEAVFRGAKLARATLARGMFFGVSFAGGDLTGADLSDTNLNKADFTGATLDGVALDKATFDLGTAWPAGFAIPAEVLFIGRGTDPRLSGKGKKAVATDIAGLVARLNAIIDPKRMKRTLDMLKSGRNQLFAEVEPTHVRGIVRSQKDEDLIYSCVLTEDGTYACCTPDLSPCLGLRGEPCKHLLVLLMGLARAGQLDPSTADRWVVAASGKNHRWNKTTKNHVSDTLLRYKGVEAGEVDWRPTETIPEDFYAM